MGVGTLLTGASNSFGTFLGARAVAAVGGSAQHPVGYSLLAGYFPQARGTILDLNSSISNVGGLVAPLTAGGLLLIMGWQQIFFIVAFISVAMGMLYFLYSRKVGSLEVWPESHWPGFALREADVFKTYMAWWCM